jgi:hypothetical protein
MALSVGEEKSDDGVEEALRKRDLLKTGEAPLLCWF